MFSHDLSLPALPVPNLDATCRLVKELIAPLVDEPTFVGTVKALEEFTRPGGEGEQLHQQLLQWKSTLPGNASWLRPLWDDMYLSWREPLPLQMNYALSLKAQRWGNALPRFVRALSHVLLLLGRQALPAEPTRSGYFAMDQLASLIATRIPCEGKDTLILPPLTGPIQASVVCEGHWFLLPLLDAQGNPASESHLHTAFARIRAEAASLPAAAPIGAITAAPRSEAASIRGTLLRIPLNRLSLEALEQSLFTLCLDPASPSTCFFNKAVLGGNAANRWFDKSLQIIATENGNLGLNLEHAGCDASAWLYILNLADSLLMEESGHAPAVAPLPPLLPGNEASPHRHLTWYIPSYLKKPINAHQQTFSTQLADIDLHAFSLEHISRESIKALGCSPDAFMQLCFQTAQFQCFGELRSAYEAVAVRGFAQGRTECARPVTKEAEDLALALSAQASDSLIKNLFIKAEAVHTSRLRQCQRALGAERHMYGLATMFSLFGKTLGIKEQPAIFSDTGWKTLRTDSLSTSGVTAACVDFFGFGPVVHPGFGLGYCLQAQEVNMVVTCHRQSGLRAKEFAEATAKAAETLSKALQTA